MKKIGTLFLTLLLCFSIVGCSSGDRKGTSDITKSFKDIGYELEVAKDEEMLMLIKKEAGSETQLAVYFDGDKIIFAGYLYMPKDSTDPKDTVVGYIYVPSDSEQVVDKDIVKTAENILNEVDLTMDEFIEYAKTAYKENK